LATPRPNRESGGRVRRSRGTGSIVTLVLALLASYGLISAMALSSFDVGTVLSIPGRALDSFTKVSLQPKSAGTGAGQGYNAGQASNGGPRPAVLPAGQVPGTTPTPAIITGSTGDGGGSGTANPPGGGNGNGGGGGGNGGGDNGGGNGGGGGGVDCDCESAGALTKI